ncbi:secretory phospholipase A2 [Fusarium oxysporum f. sp. albedinis]|nr:secretory phospholipase A2 [Fusarium oxysporum f. sp. albedinis]
MWPSRTKLFGQSSDKSIILRYKMKLSFWLFVTFAAGSTTAPAADESPSNNIARQDRCTAAEVDRLLFEVDLDTFMRARDARNPPCLDWSSNECSWSPDMPAGFNFIPSCRRHDFGYQNVRGEGKLTEARRLRIDDVFKMDLYNECGKYRGFGELVRRMFCMGIADIYYAAVRLCGDGNCLNFE